MISSGKQTFYLIDEAQNPGKGANSVISMVHHFFQWYGYGETDENFTLTIGRVRIKATLSYGMGCGEL